MPSVIPRLQAALKPTLDFISDPEFQRLLDDPAIANFALGNPQELPLAELVSALQVALQPKDKNWFAYKTNEGPSQRVIAESVSSRLGVAFAAEDICVTNGGFGAIANDEMVERGLPGFERSLAEVGARA